MDIVIVTRHQGLVEFLAERGVTGKVISHASVEDVWGKIVIGVLPPLLQSEAHVHINVDMNVPADKRGKELTKDEVREYFVAAVPRQVVRLDKKNPRSKIGEKCLAQVRRLCEAVNS